MRSRRQASAARTLANFGAFFSLRAAEACLSRLESEGFTNLHIEAPSKATMRPRPRRGIKTRPEAVVRQPRVISNDANLASMDRSSARGATLAMGGVSRGPSPSFAAGRASRLAQQALRSCRGDRQRPGSQHPQTRLRPNRGRSQVLCRCCDVGPENMTTIMRTYNDERREGQFNGSPARWAGREWPRPPAGRRSG